MNLPQSLSAPLVIRVATAMPTFDPKALAKAIQTSSYLRDLETWLNVKIQDAHP